MTRTGNLISLIFIAIIAFACSSGDGQVVPSETDDCPAVDARTCGQTSTGQQAVLVCSSAPQRWTVDDYCLGNCIFDPALGAVCETFGDSDATQGDTLTPDIQGDLVTDQPSGDLLPDTVTPLDAKPDGETPDEVTFPDLKPDLTPPWIAATTPEDGEMNVTIPFAVQITFTEPMHAPTIAPQTIHMTDIAGKEVELIIEFADDDNKVVQLVPTTAIFHSSPYEVTLDPIIKDLAGNMLGNTYQFTFYTQPVQTLGSYQSLAEKFAPVLYQETYQPDPKFDYLTAVDFDGDWVAENNVENAKSATSFSPLVYYSVTETKSHFFITYMFFYPHRYAESESNRFGNDVSGTVVIVRKGDEAPIAIETYFKPSSNDERSFSYLTDESALLPAGKTFTDLKFDGMYPQATLFPDNRYVGYLSARKHESCLWLHENNSFLAGCQLNSGIKNSMQKIEYVFNNGAVNPITKEGSAFPAGKTNVGYALEHLLASLWPRRGDLGPGLLWASDFSYSPHTSTIFTNRPGLANKVPSSFIDPIGNDEGRPPWAWRHYPGNGSSFYQMNRGVVFLDPAVHFKQRHDQSNNWADWDSQAGFGWSVDYCFNPYFGLDFRGVWPECTSN